ncbi:MAG: protein-L-isoaspartate(D-aspartate) O-methyltransferase [Fastidiosipilaceae bacterium]
MSKQAIAEFYLRLDRSFFLNEENKKWARQDAPLPIGHGQTISQPSLVLSMTQHLSPEADSKVLEIGTGSGYQTAFLAEFAREVYTVERIEELSRQARSRLRELGYENVFYKVDDGSSGWQERAPFDRIIVTAAAGTMPVELIDQLDVNGRMIVPVGPPSVQDLLLITKDEKGNVGERVLAQVRFVEMVGDYGW